MLNHTSATAYAANLIGEGFALVRCASTEVDGVACVEVTFQLNGRYEAMFVWVEGDKLYGEW